MSLPPLWNMECLTWRIPLFTNNSDTGEDPGFAPPESWAQALAGVAQDLRCLRFGPEVVVDRLIWEFSINSDYNVTIGWQAHVTSADSATSTHCRWRLHSRTLRCGSPTQFRQIWPATTSFSGRVEDAICWFLDFETGNRCGLIRTAM